jgi:prevent-host-death family protein
MTTVGARELKNRLGKYLRQVQRGATVVVTKRGRPVAELRPVTPARGELELRLQELGAEGLLALPIGNGSTDFPPVVLPGGPLSETVIEDREDRF